MSSFLNSKCSINQTSQEGGKKALLHPPNNPNNEDKTRKTSTPLKVTSLKVSAKVSRVTTTANAHHKITNASQDYEFHTMEKKMLKKISYLSVRYSTKTSFHFCYQ